MLTLSRKATHRHLSLVLTCLGLTFNLAFADHDTACRNTPGVNLAYADHRFEAGDPNAVVEIIPPEQRLPGIDWLIFMNQVNPLQSFMYPPGWQPGIIPTDVWSGDSGVRLDAPDGRAALEVFIDVELPFSPRGGPAALDDVAAFALAQVLDDTTYQILCTDSATAPELASMGVQNLFMAVSSPSHLAVVKVISMSSPQGPTLAYIVYGGPIGEFEALVRHVFVPVLYSFPKPGGGCNDCAYDEPDRDGDGTCDRCDPAPDDPNVK